MYINIGSGKLIRKKEIIGIFDLDTSSHEKETRDFLRIAEKNNLVEVCGNDLPKAFVVTRKEQRKNGIGKKKIRKDCKVYLTTLSAASLAGRGEKQHKTV